MDLLSSCLNLVGSLTSGLQNGNSLFGTLMAPTLPLAIPIPGNACPWGGRTVNNSDPYTEAPNTGVTRTYEFNITKGPLAPDGYQKDVYLINGQFPGPLIEANWGDYVEVTVNNHIVEPDEGTTLHWHGFLVKNVPWMDGVPGVSQCPIAPGKSFTYKFQASLYGSSWYHSHYSSQLSDGLFGPVVIHGPNDYVYDVDVGPIMVGDWFHQNYSTIVEQVLAPNSSGRTYSDSNLIQGKMHFDCSTVTENDTTSCADGAGLAKFKFQTGRTHRLRFINTGSQGVERISIDGHNMTVIANDFVTIEPYETSVVTLGVGQRVDVLVTADAGRPTSAFWLRANLTSCSQANQPYGLAAIYYDAANTNMIPNSQPWDVPDPGTCANDDLTLTRPAYKIPVPEPSYTGDMSINVSRNETGSLLWTFGGRAAHVDFNNPTLLQAKSGNLTFDDDAYVQNFSGNTSVRFIINNPLPVPHPIHAHGLNMYILSSGPGFYDNKTVVNPQNPMRRDVQNVQPGGHIVVQLDTTNTGAWPFHCHISWHASAGFFSQLLFNPEELANMEIPDAVQQTCRDWDEYTRRQMPFVFDSGLKA